MQSATWNSANNPKSKITNPKSPEAGATNGREAPEKLLSETVAGGRNQIPQCRSILRIEKQQARSPLPPYTSIQFFLLFVPVNFKMNRAAHQRDRMLGGLGKEFEDEANPDD